ncbi:MULTISPECIES: hypothetical protein [Saccharothrix]|uniref:hypothetical protein n=1 Tax=Saccharothrix TaxID=2071 RepID=UPI00093CF554|nr:hypothetical protein [Saccharothrix sp. CB00851]OKI25240.1 hypothetical protein A6A25_33180 [Saccharothrix sp. CB00851]
MIEVERRKRPGVAFAGFLVSFALQVALVAAFRTDYLADAGWQSGEYADAFIGIAAVSVVVGLVIKFFGPPWNSVGTGLVIAGTLGFVLLVAFVVWVLVAWSQMRS